MHKRTLSIKLSLNELWAVRLTISQALKSKKIGDIYQDTLIRELMNGLLLKIANKMYNWSGLADSRKSLSVSIVEAAAFIQLYQSDDTFYGEYEDTIINYCVDIMDKKIKSNQNSWTLTQSLQEGTTLRV